MLAEHGAKVVVNDLGGARDGVGADLGPADEVVAEIRAKGGEAIANGANVADFAGAKGMIDQAIQTYGRLDVLVNNAGILRFSLLENTSLEDYELVIRINQIGCFLGMKSVIPAMRRAGGGSIVNISSLAGMQGVGGAIAYTASKFAVRGMTKVAAIELGAHSIRVNSVHPGGIETPMTRPFGAAGASEGTGAEPRYTSPIPRIGRPEEVANLVLWLASDKSSYCTGAEFVIDGGENAGTIHTILRDLLAQ
jgi:3alpha(or 20beta)-hydroxysteroid dehydrogenase